MNSAPIAFFCYKRPEHTLQSLISLSQNQGAKNSHLFIYCDAPKKEADERDVRSVREVVKSQKWCGRVDIIERETNLGLANSIIEGVTNLCREYDRAIVLEDDLILSPVFLDYMNCALDLYRDSPQVMQISGHMFPVEVATNKDALFLPFTTSWGWATWWRAWQFFDSKMEQYRELENNIELQKQFDLNSSYPYLAMLERQIAQEIDSWAIRWYLSVFMQQGLALYPKYSLVDNIGFDGSGTHCADRDLIPTLNIYREQIKNFPNSLTIEVKDRDLVYKYLKKKSRYNRQKIVNQIKSWKKLIK
jgi:hypothetical protein